MFYNYSCFNSLKTDLESINFDVLVLGFNKSTPYFLTRKYYKLLEYLKTLSSIKKCVIIFTFYIKNSHKYVNGLIIKNSKVESVFGEAFSQKQGEFLINNKKMAVLFYFDLYSKINKDILRDFSIVIGLEDDKLENFNFIYKKFLKRLVVVDSCFIIKPHKNIDKICENMCKYYVQI